MHLPESLQQAINDLLEKSSLSSLIDAREALTRRYRSGYQSDPCITTDMQRKAYLASRVPATFSAIVAVMKAIIEKLPGLHIDSLLDLGAGPGTAMWAVTRYFPHLSAITLVEYDRSLATFGKQLASFGDCPAIISAKWEEKNLEQPLTLPLSDLVIMSYSLGELNPVNDQEFITRCWNSTSQLLVIVEPGTPVGYERILKVRDLLIGLAGYLVAPCPHMNICPMEAGDWCHFAARVERSSLHRLLKEGELNYEDEKFSYVVFSKQPFQLTGSRVIARPDLHGGHMKLRLCCPQGIETVTLSKKMGEVYKRAKKLHLGDAF